MHAQTFWGVPSILKLDENKQRSKQKQQQQQKERERERTFCYKFCRQINKIKMLVMEYSLVTIWFLYSDCIVICLKII